MRVVLAGKNDAAADCLEFLLAQGDEVLVVAVQADDGEDGWQRSLKKLALSRSVAVEQPSRINAPASVARLAEFGADLLVSIQYDQILREPLFRGVPHPCLNLHFSLLPRNRGVAPIAWAILNGDEESGVSLHHMIEDIDAGDLVEQRRVPIGLETTARELYDRLSEEAVRLFCSAHPFGGDLLGRRIEQDPARASYHRAGDFDFSRRTPDWSRPAAELQRWFRSMIFPPFQYPQVVHHTGVFAVRRLEGELGPDGGEPAGTVLGHDVERGTVEVAARGGSLRLRHLAALLPDGRLRETPASLFRPADRFGVATR